MPTKKRIKAGYVDAFIQSRKIDSECKEKTVTKYRAVILKALDALDEAGLPYCPRKIGRNEINYLRQNHFQGNSKSHDRWRLSIFGEFLIWYDNNIVKKMKIPHPASTRINVNWLEPIDSINLLRAAQGIEKLVVHFELILGLRRIDLLRLTVDDIHPGYLNVLGKGRSGGKVRTVAFAEGTEEILFEWLEKRNLLIEQVKAINPKAEVPKALLIYKKGRRLKAFGETAIDNIIKKVSKRAGLSSKVANHTLRRTCGRELYKADVPMITIADILGHSEIRTTQRYVGIRLDDQQLAFTKRDEYRVQIEKGMEKK